MSTDTHEYFYYLTQIYIIYYLQIYNVLFMYY